MNYYNNVRDRLGNRIIGFDYIFDYLRKIDNPLIVETGCARLEDNFSGDGQSSLLFDQYISEYGGEFHTVDISEVSVEYCKNKMISKNSNVILDDSINYLNYLNKKFLSQNRKIDFLYLDSFDAPIEEPETLIQSSIHHLYEFITILPSLKNGSIIGIDDNYYDHNGYAVGKGRLIFEYMNRIGNKPLLKDYQLIYQI